MRITEIAGCYMCPYKASGYITDIFRVEHPIDFCMKSQRKMVIDESDESFADFCELKEVKA